MKLGERRKDVWAGELIHECEFVCALGNGQMIFFDIDSKCFRLCFWVEGEKGKFILNGWNCADTIQDLLKKNE